MSVGLFHVPDMEDEDEDFQEFIPIGEELPEFEDDFIPGHSEGLISEEMSQILELALNEAFIDVDNVSQEVRWIP